MLTFRRTGAAALAAAFALGALGAGCGSGDDDGSTTGSSATAAAGDDPAAQFMEKAKKAAAPRSWAGCTS